MTLGLFGGAFDPPHRGHVELARSAARELGLDRLLVLVDDAPGHKRVETPGETRLRLAEAAFPAAAVSLNRHARTIDALRAHPEWGDTVFLIGADQFADFLGWQEPDEVLRRTRVAVATRPGFPQERLDGVLRQLEQPGRVLFFASEPIQVASSDVRARIAAGEGIAGDVPSEVARIIESEGLYRDGRPAS